MAKNLGCEAKEIYFTSGGTEADNLAIKGVAYQKGSGHIITSRIEHHAVLYTVEYLEKHGFSATYLDVDDEGRVNPADVEKAIRPDTILISIMAANNEIGTIEPIAEIGRIARAHGVLFHTDAVQAVGHIPVNVNDWNVDMLSLAAHKFHGPKGVGALYVKKGVRLTPVQHGGGHEKGLRSGTENTLGIVGMGAAIEHETHNLEANMARMSKFSEKLFEGIKKIPRAYITGSLTHRLPQTVSCRFDCIEGEAIVMRLDEKGISASSGSACSTGSLDPSHVLLSIGLKHEQAHGSLRLSLGDMNTEGDIDYILEVLPGVVAGLRRCGKSKGEKHGIFR
jgi:cysteine desulfurase